MIYSFNLPLFSLDSVARSAFSCIYCLSWPEIMLNLCFLLCQGNKVALSHASLYANSVSNINILLSFYICFYRVSDLKGATTL